MFPYEGQRLLDNGITIVWRPVRGVYFGFGAGETLPPTVKRVRIAAYRDFVEGTEQEPLFMRSVNGSADNLPPPGAVERKVGEAIAEAEAL